MAQQRNGFSGSQSCPKWPGGVCLAEASRSERQDKKSPTSNSHLHLTFPIAASASAGKLLQVASLVEPMQGPSAQRLAVYDPPHVEPGGGIGVLRILDPTRTSTFIP
ncbi:hypothetical protein [Mesorhizobium sp.]|uniref:hypothetical protein n=1 Tax=Mesorhizobium sp. TaxID=1871066 RepID=UPI0025EA39AB|nr:hypothetical protein [Mesorhizobium sp.]